MKLCSSKKEYIDAIAPAVQRACKRYGYLPSVLIGQSCLENGYGVRAYFDNPEIVLLLEANNMVGIKSNLLSDSWNQYTVWNGESIKKKTPEEYGGSIETITDKFRKYNSIEESFVDYLLFMKYGSNYGPGGKPKYGDEVLSIKDPETLIKTVSSRGYATGSTYPKSVMRIIRENNLTKYDDLTNVKPTDIVAKKSETKKEEKKVEKINIIKKYITTNNSNSTNNPIAIVIHNTDNFARTANAYAHAEGLYHGYMEGMSWHYVVDDKEIYQCLPHNRGAWHVGRNFGSNNLFGVINNRNSIGIEMCVNAGYDYEKAFQNTVKLTKYLMQQLNIPADKVYQHYDICTKDCPSQIRKRGDWGRFKKLISENGTTVTTLQKGDSGEDVRAMQKLLIQAGFNCGKTGADGDFGTNTENALKAFQRAAWILADGKYTETVKKALTAYINKNKKEDSKKESKEEKKSTWKATGTATATVDDLNVRKGPGTNYDIIRSLNAGNRFEVDGNKDGRWIHVKVVNDIGWVHERYVKYDR